MLVNGGVVSDYRPAALAIWSQTAVKGRRNEVQHFPVITPGVSTCFHFPQLLRVYMLWTGVHFLESAELGWRYGKPMMAQECLSPQTN
jgi:hypothetical protein